MYCGLCTVYCGLRSWSKPYYYYLDVSTHTITNTCIAPLWVEYMHAAFCWYLVFGIWYFWVLPAHWHPFAAFGVFAYLCILCILYPNLQL